MRARHIGSLLVTAVFFTFLMVMDELMSMLDAWGHPGHGCYAIALLGCWLIGDVWTWIVFPALTACYFLIFLGAAIDHDR